MTSTKQIKSQPSANTKFSVFTFKCGKRSWIISEKAIYCHFYVFCPKMWIPLILWNYLLSIDRRRRKRRGGDTAGLKRQRNHLSGKCLFYWKQYSVTATRTGEGQDRPLTKMQFYRHTRADFLWVTNIPAACQVSKRTEPHSGSDHLEHRPLSAKNVSVKKIQILDFFHS